MLSTYFIAALGLCQAVIAAPNSKPKYTSKAYNANVSLPTMPLDMCNVADNLQFDDRAALPASLNPVGTYNGLVCNGFNVAQMALVGGVTRHTPPNAAAYGVYGMVINGVPTLSPSTSGANFDLHSFYYGCVVNTAQTAAGGPTACQITVTGYKKLGSQTFSYNPKAGIKSATMNLATLNSWAKSLTSVQFSTAGNTLIGSVFDNFQYTVHTPAK